MIRRHYPDDPEVIGLQNQYLLGADVLVLPVLEPGADSVRGYFPDGDWIHLLTGEPVRGPLWRTVEAPPGRPAAFVRSGSVWAPVLSGAVRE